MDSLIVLDKESITKGIIDDDILFLVQEFINESTYNITFNKDRSLDHIYKVVQSKECNLYLAYLDFRPSGFSMVCYDSDFMSERFGYVMKFYVHPFARGTYVGRKLIEETTKWFDANNCIDSFATSTAGIGQDKEFQNLLGKFKYEPCGVALKRGLNVKI